MTNWTYISDLDAFELYHLKQESDSSSSAAAAFYAFLPALRQALAGSAGTAISNVAVYPLDLVVTRLKVQRRLKGEAASSVNSDHDTHYDGVTDAIAKIYKHEGGLPAFYGGVIPDTVKSVADSFFFFLAYNLLRRLRSRWPSSKFTVLQVVDQIGLGMAAGAFAKLLTTPIQMIVTHKQIAAVASARQAADKEPRTLGRKLSIRQIVDQIQRNKGILGFWSGYSATLLLTLNPAITFFLDSFFRRAFRVGEQPRPSTTFLLAAFGKAAASTMLYPLSMAKSRAQASAASSKEVDDEQGSLPKRSEVRRTEKTTQSSSVASAILEILRTEGVVALYAGLTGEVLKGFFSHGLTMLIKERLYSLVIRLYNILAKHLRQLKSYNT